MNLLVTGGCGFIGSNFIRLLLNGNGEYAISKDCKIVNLDALTYAGNLDNLSSYEEDTRYDFVKGSIENTALLESLFSQYRFTAIINFAAESHVDRSIDTPEPFFQTNVIGTLRLMDVARKYWNQCDAGARDRFRFLHVSTDEVYGTLNESDPAFTETTPFAPNSPYAASKAASDFIVRAGYHTYGMPVLTTNCSNNYGSYQFPEKLIPLMILNALENKPLPIYGNGLNVRDWLYVEDHCKAIWTVLQKGAIGETYNVGGLNEMTNIQIVDTLCEILDELRPRPDGSSYKSLKKFVQDRPGHDKRYAIDCSKIQRELGWTPCESFATGIRKTVQWYLEHSDWCQAIAQKKYQRERLGLK